jgi:hypothetical protein
MDEFEEDVNDYTEGKIFARKMIREALLRLDDGNKGGKWSIEFILKFLALDSSPKSGGE